MRFGVIGAGRMGAFHARVLAGLPHAEQLCICDADPAVATRLAVELQATTAATPEQLIEQVDAVVIAAPTPLHAPLIHLGLEAGVATFCEKPIALDLQATDDVLAAAERTGTYLQIGFQRRFDAGYVALRARVKSGDLGRVFMLRLATHDPSPPPRSYVAVSGGIYRDLHIHDFDILRWVTGQEVVEVYADGSVLQDAWFADEGDVDTSAVMLRMSDGTLALASGVRNDPRGYDVRMELFAERDSLVCGVDPRTPLRSVEPQSSAASGAQGASGAGGEYSGFLDRFADAYRDQMVAFAEAVEQKLPSPCTGFDAYQALLIATAAERSRLERRPVSPSEVQIHV